MTAFVGGAQQMSVTRRSNRRAGDFPACARQSNFRMAESKISMLSMRVHNKIAVCLAKAMLFSESNTNDDVLPTQN